MGHLLSEALQLNGGELAVVGCEYDLPTTAWHG